MTQQNRYKITVTFPTEWTDEPTLAGTTQEFFYRTLTAMDDAARGFRIRGCVVS
jgi:hypothetical protein